MGACFSEQAAPQEGKKETQVVPSPSEVPLATQTSPESKATKTTDHHHRKIVILKGDDLPGKNLGGHILNESEHYTVHYPAHAPRQDTPLYRKTHKELCIKQDLPCFICGKTRKENKDLETETHHFFCEKAGENAVDWKKFAKRAQTLYNPQTGLHLGSAYDWDEVCKSPDLFVDSEGNMVVLCPECHRSSHRGIHHVPFPEWFLQSCVLEGFVVLI